MKAVKGASIFLAVLLAMLAAEGAAARKQSVGEKVPSFTRIDQGGILTGTLVEVKPTKGNARVSGMAGSVTDGSLSLTCDGGCESKVVILAPAGFDTIATSGEGGLIKVSDHDADPLTCEGGIFEVPEFKVSVSGTTNVSLGCIRAPKITIVQTGQVSAVSLWWTVETELVEITNTGEGASTHIIGPTKEVSILATGEKATVTVRDPAAKIQGKSVGGRVFHAQGGTGSCDVTLPGPLGSACMALPTDDAGVIRDMGLASWQGVSSQSISP